MLITRDIKKIVQERVDGGYAPAIVMATVSENGEEYHEYGSLSYRKSEARVSRNTLFEIGSITKTFTGILLADLVLKKKVDIDDSIAKYFPKLEKIKHVTLRYLVTHSSGLPSIPDNFIDSETLQGDPWKNYSADKLFAWLEGVDDKELSCVPGSEFNYCNSGMGLLGCILSKVYEKPYETAIAEIILEPLQMTNTHFSPTLESQRTQFAVPHFGEHEVPAWNLQKSIAAAGGLRSTTQDFIKYIKAQLGLTHQDTPIGKAIKLSHSVLFTDKNTTMCYGIGIIKASTADDKLKNTWYTHDGGTGGSVSSLILDLHKQIGGVIFCNADCERNLEILQGTIFPEILTEILDSIKIPSVAELNQDSFSSLCGEYVENDCLVTVIPQNKKITLNYNEHHRMEYNKVVFAQEIFYPKNEGLFFSKSSDDILKFDIKTTEEDERVRILKIGDEIFEKFKRSPTIDNILNPHKFETLWVKTLGETIFINTSMGIGKKKALVVEQDIEIFASHVPSEHQIDVINQGVDQHSEKYEENLIKKSKINAAVLKRSGQPIFGIYGFSYKTVLTIADFPLQKEGENLIGDFFRGFVTNLDPIIKKIYAELPSNHCGVKAMSGLGFHIEESGYHSKINLWVDIVELKKRFSNPLPSTDISIEMCTKEYFFQCFSEQEEPKALTEQFGIFLQNEEKQIVGGSVCTMEEKYLFVDLLWIHESMRGQKISEKLVDLAERHAKQKGGTDSRVATASCQAPWLYPKLGYQEVSSVPLGPYQSLHYRKSLLN